MILFCSMAPRNILADIADIFRQRTGQRLDVRAMGGVEAARLARSTNNLDIIALARDAMETLEPEAILIAGSRVDFARSGIAIAIPAGMRAPDLHNGDAVRAAMLAANNIGYSTGPSGDYLQALWQRWTISDVMMQRAVQASPGVPVAHLVAQGKVDLGFQQLSELQGQPGISIAGLLPADIQKMTTFSAAVSAKSSNPEIARKFLSLLTGDEAAEVIKKHGMEPAYRPLI